MPAAVSQAPAIVKAEDAGEKEAICPKAASDADSREPAQARDTDDIPITQPRDVENIRDDRRDTSRGDKAILVIEDDPDFARTLMEMARRTGLQGTGRLGGWRGAAPRGLLSPQRCAA